jgi:hypothetical protein
VTPSAVDFLDFERTFVERTLVRGRRLLGAGRLESTAQKHERDRRVPTSEPCLSASSRLVSSLTDVSETVALDIHMHVSTSVNAPPLIMKHNAIRLLGLGTN